MNKFAIEDAFWSSYGQAYRALCRTLEVLLWLLEFLLFTRALFVFLKVNPETLVVSQLYLLTDVILMPFWYILPDYIWHDRPIELTTVTAMAGYFVAGLLTLALVKLFRHNHHRIAASPTQYR